MTTYAPTHQVDIQKYYGTRYWTNRYLIYAANWDAAVLTAQNLVTAERAFHLPAISYSKMRVSSFPADNNEFQMFPLGGNGTRTGSSGSPLALFNCLRLDFAAGMGRPSRKFFRGCLTENDITGDSLEGVTTTYFASKVGALYAAGMLVDPQGEVLAAGVPWPRVQMRQLTRGSRRATRPII